MHLREGGLGKGASCELPGCAQLSIIPAMHRTQTLVLGLVVALPLACGESKVATVTPSAGLSASVRQTAVEAPDVERMKLRFDAEGKLVKQAVYHGDADAIPAAVRATAESTHPGAKALSYETEFYADQGEVFEVELETAEGQACEVAANAAGELLYTECRIEVGELPAAVAASVEASFAGGKLLEAERKLVEGSEFYSVEVEVEGREYYLKLDAEGTLLHRWVMVPAVVELPLD